MVEAAPRPVAIKDPIMSWKRIQEVPPMQVPDYAASPDVFDDITTDELIKKHQIRRQTHYVLTREDPSGATAESLGSIVAHIHQIESELINRGITPTFTPVETSAKPRVVYSNEE